MSYIIKFNEIRLVKKSSLIIINKKIISTKILDFNFSNILIKYKDNKINF